jgi:hypothetical protein
MKWILSALVMAVSMFMNNVKTVTAPNVLQQSRKVLGLAYAGLIGSTLFSAGIIITVLNWPSYDYEAGALAVMPPFIGGICLSVTAIIALIFIFLPRNWSPEPTPRKESGFSNLENALTILVMDFVKQRENDRERRGSNSSEAHL